jgi:Zn-dependent protease
MSGLSTYQLIAVSILPLLFAITVHEVAHGWMAKRLGDPTAQRLGRLTLNPLKHIDPMGTVVVPLIMLFATGFVFGWAKPVPVTYENLRHPKRDMAIVAIAGPGSNLLMAVLWAFVAKIATLLPGGEVTQVSEFIFNMGVLGVSINIVLMLLNLIPLPPLDGGRVAVGLLPGPLAWKFSRIEPYGFFIIIGLVVLSQVSNINILGYILGAPSRELTMRILSVAGLS